MSKLLINENPLVLCPTLAVILGVNDAIVVQQLHYWLAHARTEHNGKKWVYKTIEEWRTQDFKFWSERTIRTIFKRLEKAGLVLSAQLADNSYNRVKYYTICYEKLEQIEQAHYKAEAELNNPEQSDADQDKPLQPFSSLMWQHLPNGNGSICLIETATFTISKRNILPNVKENTKENTKETTQIGAKKTAPPKPKKSRSVSYPDDFAPAEAHKKKAEDRGLNLARELDNFKHHHIAKGSKFVNWSSAFHKWLNNSTKFKEEREAQQQQPQLNTDGQQVNWDEVGRKPQQQNHSNNNYNQQQTYHPSYNLNGGSPKAPADHHNYCWFNGLWFAPLAGMTVQECNQVVSQYAKRYGKSTDEAYSILASQSNQQTTNQLGG